MNGRWMTHSGPVPGSSADATLSNPRMPASAPPPLLTVDDLRVAYPTRDGGVSEVVRGVSFTLGRERLARTADRLEYLLQQRLEAPRRDLARLAAQLDALSPLKVLDRGYGMARDAEGRVLRRVADFPPGLPFTLRVADGDVAARAEGT